MTDVTRYVTLSKERSVIQTFGHKGLRELFERGSHRGVGAALAGRITRLLDRLDAAAVVEDMDLPGFHLHQLKGHRKGTWSIRVSGNRRITFRFESGDAYDADLEDYH